MATERKLTEKEIIRKEKIQKIIDKKVNKGYRVNNLTISVMKANVLAIVLCLPIIVPFFILFILNHSFQMDLIQYILLLVVFLIGVVVHEGIHGFFWGLFARNHYQSIEFGFIVEMLTPYCTCLEPLKKGQYIIGCMMPGVILGIIPSFISLFTGSTFLLGFGLFNIFGAGGDLAILCKLIAYKGSQKSIYLDHPTECGLIVFEK